MPKEIRYIKTDVVVIGGGLSGLMAAKAITEDKSIQVMMLRTGLGASPYVHGFNIPLHKEDSVELFIRDTLESGKFQSEAALAEKLCHDSSSILTRLEELGLAPDKNGDGFKLLKPLGSSLPRVASIGNETGIEIIKRVNEILTKRDNFSLCFDVRAIRLMVKEGRLCGVFAYDIRNGHFTFIQARAAILACGGFCNIYPFSTNKFDIGGDGIAMAYEAGIPLVDMEFIQFEPSAAVAPKQLKGKSVITTMFYEGAVLRNVHGERFMLQHSPDGERVNKDVMSRYIYEEIKKGNGTKNGGVYFDATGVGEKRLLEAYSSYYERYIKHGIDISKEMFEIAPAPHTSLGGVKTGVSCDTPIQGIYVCGEMIGGIHGANRIGGNAGLETLVFGNQAGLSARDYLQDAYGDEDIRWQEWVRTNILSDDIISKAEITPERMAEIREQMQHVLNEYVNVIRCESELKEAVRVLSLLRNELETGPATASEPALYTWMRLKNDVLTAYLVAVAALERKESVGCHVRADNTSGPKEKYRVILQKKEQAEHVYHEPIK